MTYPPRRRRSIRLPRFDYSTPGAYFITICTHRRAPILAEVVHGELVLTGAGRLAEDEWLRSGSVRSEIVLDAFVVMPDHLHGIVFIAGGPTLMGPTPSDAARPERAHGPLPGSIGAFVAGFKAAATARINRLRRTPGAAAWQRNYYEHVIRCDMELHRMRAYIDNNPPRWIAKAGRLPACPPRSS